MFKLPSMWNLIVSTIMFFIAAWYFHRVLDEQGIPKGMMRGLLVFVLAYIVSWGAGEAIDWTTAKIQGPQAVSKAPDDLSVLLRTVNQSH